MNRRGFLGGLLAAPAVIVTPGLLMPVKVPLYRWNVFHVGFQICRVELPEETMAGELDEAAITAYFAALQEHLAESARQTKWCVAASVLEATA